MECCSGVVASVLDCRSEGPWFDFARAEFFRTHWGQPNAKKNKTKWVPGVTVGKQRQLGNVL